MMAAMTTYTKLQLYSNLYCVSHDRFHTNIQIIIQKNDVEKSSLTANDKHSIKLL